MDILAGMNLQTVTVIYGQLFIVIEFLIYIILFNDAYKHNQELHHGNLLGSMMSQSNFTFLI